MTTPAAPRTVGRYAIYDPIATGGMATVHLGRLVGPVGFARTVAIKRLHPQYARDPEFVSMFLDEARVAARVQHPNVVPTIDVIATEGELLLVMEYVRGEALGRLLRAATKSGGLVPPRIVVGVLTSALAGLHAAHEANDEAGRPLGIVHRDVSPQNILVGVDGVARVLDFGVAKAEDRVQVTKDNKLKGKLLYMAPEQLEGGQTDRRIDVYAMAVVLYEALTLQRMFTADNEAAQLAKIVRGEIVMPSRTSPSLAPFDEIVRKGAAKYPADRFATAREMARALEAVVSPASPSDVADWVQATAGADIHDRTRRIAEIESVSRLDANAVRASLEEELRRSQVSIPGASSGESSGVKPPPASARTGVAFMWMVVPFLVVLAAGAAAIAVVASRRAEARDHAALVASPAATSRDAPARVEHVAAAPPPTTETLPSASAPVEEPSAATPVVHHATSKKRDCDQPYVIDASGHMHFRRECL